MTNMIIQFLMLLYKLLKKILEQVQPKKGRLSFMFQMMNSQML